MRLLVIYLFTVALSACLLFAVQPLVGRLVLPLYGGSPAVWNTCMMFFQAVLLLGYLYAHLSDRWLSVRGQMYLHIGVMIAAGFLLPISVPDGWTIDDPQHPAWSLLKLLALTVGGPFFAMSANATLLQRWFSATNHPSAPDPYFLYAVSNAGSMVGLLSYPFLIEPNFGLSDQTTYWAIGFGGLLIGVVASVILTAQNRGNGSDATITLASAQPAHIDWSHRAMWVLLAFVPSSWLLSVTTRLTTDIAPIPLLWVVPLAIYLLTFVLAFASRVWIPHLWNKHALAATAIVLVAATVASRSMGLAALHLFAFFLGAMVCHGELVRRRPNASGLTEFYLWLSVGGVLGGFFNAIVAPNLFSVLLEFGIVVAAACLFTGTKEKKTDANDETVEAKLLRPTSSAKKRKRRKASPVVQPNEEPTGRSLLNLQMIKQHWPLSIAAVLAVVLLRGVSSDNASSSMWMTLVVVLLIPTLIGLRVAGQTIAFSFLVGAALMVDEFDAGPQYEVVHRARSFFGRHLVVDDRATVGMGQQPRYRRLLHGTTQHGFQSLDPLQTCEPLAYYHRTGPLGDLFSTYITNRKSAVSEPTKAAAKRVAAIGLGTGAVACYANPNCDISFIEVDPTVRDIAKADGYFSYLSNCGGENCDIIMADGRQAMSASEDGQYDMVLLDAFSSDAVPTHLMTREAIQMYIDKLGPGGVLAFHISNKYLRLDHVLTAAAAELNLAYRAKHDRFLSAKDREESIRKGKADAWYFVIAKQDDTLQKLTSDWQKPDLADDVRVWTDDYCNILSVMQIGR
ncbi:fused MFS/spermidine synthase [Planctomycetes bacterium K23_9]|uniref:Spermidine synthase n=1 Tax=Stieleria marina TaxID=1930275 RepID=A0A517P1N5_9BACT|nr:spermidine synthase [Planctomycetes bacterium K23_9]